MLLSSNDWMEEEEYLGVDYNHMQRKQHTLGFREGVSSGQEYVLQQAFNAGYTFSGPCFERMSHCRGVLSGLLMYLLWKKEKCPNQLIEEIENLISCFEKCECEELHKEELYKQIDHTKHLTTHVKTKQTLELTEDVIENLSDLMNSITNNESVKCENENIDNDNIEEANKSCLSGTECSGKKCYVVDDQIKTQDCYSKTLFFCKTEEMKLSVINILDKVEKYIEKPLSDKLRLNLFV
ncbi:protein YAE1 homolog isoform X2 [Hydractinia symbiolongicarpus]|nr:protein YAE1 homolog isoform X2 [Hydractinia symbiolongicarpus]XP_057293861.1 protein YAE1 homolog isoform X2 [Hydractinia symbiolongicarpus]XP_057293862.1 protein YAE1 homolog isoform X2 [Hydractinia symbiolongicarpus]